MKISNYNTYIKFTQAFVYVYVHYQNGAIFNNTLYDLQNELTKFRFKFIENVAVCGQYIYALPIALNVCAGN